jgi:hypothetical protein
MRGWRESSLISKYFSLLREIYFWLKCVAVALAENLQELVSWKVLYCSSLACVLTIPNCYPTQWSCDSSWVFLEDWTTIGRTEAYEGLFHSSFLGNWRFWKLSGFLSVYSIELLMGLLCLLLCNSIYYYLPISMWFAHCYWQTKGSVITIIFFSRTQF